MAWPSLECDVAPMVIDADVKRIAKRFGAPAELIQSVVKAEGNIVKAVECSTKLDPNRDKREQALEITCRSAAHALFDFVQQGGAGAAAFVDFWAQRWAPVGASNDPTSLNKHWPVNVKKFWLG